MHLSKPYSFTLLRETTVFQQKTDTPGYSTLSVWGLSDVLDIPVEQYIRLCILCFGNDFMPMLGMFSLREGGHERALEMYSKCGQPDMSTSRGVMRFVTYAKQFETPLLMSKVLERDKRSEKSIVSSDGAYLEQRYNEHVLDGVVDIQPVVAAFWKTYIWTVRYFTTNEVPDWTWHYPYPDAPLVSQLSVYHEPTFNTDPPTFGVVQQLQFILPMTSLRTTKKRVLYPNEMYNEETDMRFPWMRRYAWESKPRISLPWSPTRTETKIEVFRR
jgi:5'-3' exonuclease